MPQQYTDLPPGATVYTDLPPGAKVAAPKPEPPKQQGAISSFLDAAGFGGLAHKLAHPIQAQAEQREYLRQHPIRAVLEAQPGVSAGEVLYGGAKRSGGEVIDAFRSAREKNPAQAVEHLITAVPFIGPNIKRMSEQAADNGAGKRGNSYLDDLKATITSPGAMGTGVGNALAVGGVLDGLRSAPGELSAMQKTQGIPKPNPFSYDATKNLAVDIGPRNPQQAATLGPKLTEALAKQKGALAEEVARTGKKVSSMKDIADLAQSARNSARFKLYDTMLAKVENQPLVKGLPSNMIDEAHGALAKPAAEFEIPSTRRPLGNNPTLKQLDEALNSANEQAEAAYEGPSGKRAAQNAKAVADYLRPILNRKIAEATGMKPAEVGAIREQIGQLRIISDSARGNEFYIRAGTRGLKDPAIHGERGVIRPVLRAVHDAVRSPETRANRQVSKSFERYTR